jgi:periplasmic protein TonB
MNKFYIFFLIGCFVATAARSESLGAVQGWDVFESDDQTYCGMIFDYEGKGNTTLSFAKLMDDGILFMVSNDEWSAYENSKYGLSLEFDDAAYDVSADGFGGTYDKKGFSIRLNPKSGREFTAQLIRSSGIKIYLGETLVDHLSLRGSGAAIIRMNACLDKIRQIEKTAAQEKARFAHIPNDPFASAPIVPPSKTVVISKAVNPTGGSISHEDYPSRKIGGRVQFQLTINEYGQAIKCKILATSGDKLLDDNTCRIAARRLKFEPALDESGAPTTGTIDRSVTWGPPPIEPPRVPPAPKLEIQY